MFFRTISLGVQRALQDAMLNVLTAPSVAGLLTAPTVHLIKNAAASINGDYDPANLATDESDFTGYAAPALGTLIGPINGNGDDRLRHKEVDFLCTTTGASQSVYAYVITNAAEDTLYYWEVLPDPVPMGIAGNAFSLDVVIGQGAILPSA